MSDQSGIQTPDSQGKLKQVLAEYLHTVENDQPLDRSSLIAAAHLDLADDLRSFFRNRDSIQKLAEAATLVGPSAIGFPCPPAQAEA